MAVTIVKPKAKEIAKEDLTALVTPELVDSYASKKNKLDKKQAKLAPLEKEVKALGKEILSTVDEVIDAGTPVTLPGVMFELKLGAQGKRTELVDAEGVYDLLGAEAFFKLAKISVTDLKAYLTPDEVSKVTQSRYAISRRVKVELL